MHKRHLADLHFVAHSKCRVESVRRNCRHVTTLKLRGKVNCSFYSGNLNLSFKLLQCSAHNLEECAKISLSLIELLSSVIYGHANYISVK